MEQNLLESKNFRILVFLASILLLIFLGFGIALKAHETKETYLHGTLPAKTLLINADGKTKAMPDTAYISLNLTSEGKDNSEALNNGSKKINELYDFLKTQNIPKDDVNITSSYMAPTPNPQEVNQTTQNTKTVVIKVYSTEKLSEKVTAVFDGLKDKVKSAQDSGGGCLTFKKPENFLAEARQEALKEAQKKGEELAQLTGLKLGKIVTVSENSSGLSYNPIYSGGSCANIPIPNTEISKQELTSSLSVIFEVK